MSQPKQRLTKAMLAEFAAANGHMPIHVTRVWVSLARIDRRLKEQGRAGLDVEVSGSVPVKGAAVSGNTGVTAHVGLASLRGVRHLLKPRFVPGYGQKSHQILTSWLDSLADE